MYSDEQIRQIILDIQDEESPNFIKAEGIIFDTKDKRFLTIALDMLQEDNGSFVDAGLNAIRYLKKFYPSDLLSQVLPFLETPAYCPKVLEILHRNGDVTIAPKLLRFLHYPDADTRCEALRCIAILNYPNALEIALYMLNDAAPKVRSMACAIIGELKHPRAVEILIENLNDTEINDEGGSVCATAANILGRIGDKRAVEALKNVVNYGQHKRAIAAALDALWEIEGLGLQDFFVEQTPKLRHSWPKLCLVYILEKISSPEAINALIFLSLHDNSYRIQAVAARSLMSISTPEAQEAANYWYKNCRKENDS